MDLLIGSREGRGGADGGDIDEEIFFYGITYIAQF